MKSYYDFCDRSQYDGVPAAYGNYCESECDNNFRHKTGQQMAEAIKEMLEAENEKHL